MKNNIIIKKNILYPEESRLILIYDALHEVYKDFGGSFKEIVIDNALTIALEKRGLKVENQKRIDIYFQGKKVGAYIPDKVINDKILIELKCKLFLISEDKKRFWHYLKASEFKLGLLVNFSPKKLEILRRIYDLARNLNQQNNQSRPVASKI